MISVLQVGSRQIKTSEGLWGGGRRGSPGRDLVWDERCMGRLGGSEGGVRTALGVNSLVLFLLSLPHHVQGPLCVGLNSHFPDPPGL